MSKEQIRNDRSEVRLPSRPPKKASQSAETLVSRQLELSLPLNNQDQVDQPERGEALNRALAHSEAPVVSRVNGLLDPSREKHRNAIEASREELIGELSAYLRTDLKSLYEPDIWDFTIEEEAEFNAWAEDLSDDQLNEQIELRGELLTEKIKKLASQ